MAEKFQTEYRRPSYSEPVEGRSDVGYCVETGQYVCDALRAGCRGSGFAATIPEALAQAEQRLKMELAKPI